MVGQLFKIINSQHPIILANMQTITPLTSIGSCEAIFQILYTDIPSGEPTRLRSTYTSLITCALRICHHDDSSICCLMKQVENWNHSSMS